MKFPPFMVAALVAAPLLHSQQLVSGWSAEASEGPSMRSGEGRVLDAALLRPDAGAGATPCPMRTSGPTAVFLEAGGPVGLDLGEVIYAGSHDLLPDDLVRVLPAGDPADGSGFGWVPSPDMGDAGAAGSRVAELPRGAVMTGWMEAEAMPPPGFPLKLRSIPEPALALISGVGFLMLLRRRRAG